MRSVRENEQVLERVLLDSPSACCIELVKLIYGSSSCTLLL